MPLRVAYIPHFEGDLEGAMWAENTMIKNLMANTGPGLEITPIYTMHPGLYSDFDLVCHHNLANTTMRRRKWIRGGALLERLIKRPINAFHTSDHRKIFEMDRRAKIFGGIRGTQGLNKARRFLKYFDAIHVDNDYLLDRVHKCGARQAYILYPGVDMELFKPNSELTADTFTIGWAGDAKKPMKNAHLLNRLGYRSIMATKENFIPHDEMPEFYNRCHVYTYFSSHEGCNRTILEAMACGLPIVTSDAGIVRKLIDPHWIIDGEPGGRDWMARFHNRVEELRNDPALSYEVGLANRKTVWAWSWPVITRDFTLMCKRIIWGD